jgi:hypothetical protein
MKSYSQWDYAKEILKYSRESIHELTQEDKSNITRFGETNLSFVGDGNVQNSLSSGSDFSSNTGMGIIFNRFWLGDSIFVRSLDLSVHVNVASSSDTLFSNIGQRELGRYFMQPRGSNTGAVFNLDLYFNDYNKPLFRLFSGFNLNFIGSTNMLNFQSGSNVDNIDLGALSFRIGPFYEFINDKLRKEEGYSVKLSLNYSTRLLIGDLSFEENNLLKQDILKTNSNRFSGIELNARFRIRNIVAEISLPVLNGENGVNVSGLTGTQFLTSISFVGGFPIKLKKEDIVNDSTLGI